MLVLEGYTFDVIADGISYGVLPKVGDRGFLIIRKLYDGKWKFNFPADFELDKGTYWFQTWDGKKFEWFHGVMDETGKIVQIG